MNAMYMPLLKIERKIHKIANHIAKMNYTNDTASLRTDLNTIRTEILTLRAELDNLKNAAGTHVHQLTPTTTQNIGGEQAIIPPASSGYTVYTPKTSNPLEVALAHMALCVVDAVPLSKAIDTIWNTLKTNYIADLSALEEKIRALPWYVGELRNATTTAAIGPADTYTISVRRTSDAAAGNIPGIPTVTTTPTTATAAQSTFIRPSVI